MSIKSLTLAALTTLAAAAPTTMQTRSSSLSSATFTIYPTTLSLWDSSSSHITFDTSYGQISRSGQYDISTLFTFAIPSTYSSNTCELIFTQNPTTDDDSGTGKGQLFKSSRAATRGASSNFRDTQVAAIMAFDGSSRASFSKPDGTGSMASWTVPCSQIIASPNWEVAPQGEEVLIDFNAGQGLKVLVHNSL